MYGVQVITGGRQKLTEQWVKWGNTRRYRLHYVIGGKAYYRDTELLVGHLYIFPFSEISDFRLIDSYDHVYFDFFSILPITVNEGIDLNLSEYPEIEALCESLAKIYTKIKHYQIPDLGDSLFKSLMILIDCVHPLHKVLDDRISTVINYINSHYSEKITLDELANIANISKYWFVKHFKKEVGESPMRFTDTLRFNYAFKMLTEGKTISYIAEHTGFSSVDVFSRAFRNRFGTYPSFYRKSPD